MRMLFLVAMLVASPTGAADTSLPIIFGQQLGAANSLPECHRMVLQYPQPDGSPAPYTTEQSTTCQQLPDSAVPETGAIVFTFDKMPAILKVNLMLTANIAGRVEGIYASTMSYSNSDAVVAQLIEKFGQPSSSSAEKVSIDSIHAPGKVFIWARPGFTVEYHTISSSLDHGSLWIETTVARDRRFAREVKRDAQRTPL
jgi:hypothetical protein